MTTNNEFEKLALENEMDIESLNPDGSYANIETESAWLWFQDGLRIATTEANKRISELESELRILKELRQNSINYAMQMQASNNQLREALEKYGSHEGWCKSLLSTSACDCGFNKALASTPAESLQAK